MIEHTSITDTQLRLLIHNRKIKLAGNRVLKIYGLLSCASGKKMKKANRVFFKDKADAIQHRYRPCGHCLNSEYKIWKNHLVLNS